MCLQFFFPESFFLSFHSIKLRRDCQERNHFPLNVVILVRDRWLIKRQRENEACCEILIEYHP